MQTSLRVFVIFVEQRKSSANRVCCIKGFEDIEDKKIDFVFRLPFMLTPG